MPDFLDIDDLTPGAFAHLLDLCTSEHVGRVLDGSGVALLFEKASARTRNSTEMAVVGLGGHPVYIQGAEVGLDTRESAEDVARTLGCYHRVLCARVFDHRMLERMVAALAGSGFDVPVVNLLSDRSHPCQAVADVLTLRETLGPLPGRSLAYVGDANNMCRSLAQAALAEGMDFRVASPAGYAFTAEELAALRDVADRTGRGGTVSTTTDPTAAAAGVDAFYTDVWTSMGQEAEREDRLAAFAGFGIDEALVARGAPGAVVLHCLPAHRGEEIAAAVIEGPQSVVWRQAAHRRTAMRGILAWTLEAPGGAP